MKKSIQNTAIAFCAFLFAACSGGGESYKVEPLSVSTEIVSMSVAQSGRSYIGEVEEENSTPVSFTGMGTVIKVHVQEGQHVSKGQLIAEMDPTQCQNALTAAQATMDRAQDAYDRMKILHDAQSISDIDWVEVQSKLQTAKASLDMARKSLADCRLVAPCSGIVGTKSMETGMTALPSQPVCTILDITRVKVKIAVPEKEIAIFNPSQVKAEDVTITADALGGKTFHSTSFVRSVQGDPLIHTYDVRFNLVNTGTELLPGMVVNVHLQPNVADTDATVTVPIRSVQEGADGHNFVWLVKEKKACRQNVEVGNAMGNRVAILSGLSEGDVVITEGYQKVSEGSELK